MTTKNLYYCDICKEEIKEKGKLTCIGLWFTSYTSFIEKDYYETEHHLCGNCIDSLIKIFVKRGDLCKKNDIQ